MSFCVSLHCRKLVLNFLMMVLNVQGVYWLVQTAHMQTHKHTQCWCIPWLISKILQDLNQITMNADQFSKYLSLIDHPQQLQLQPDETSLYLVYRGHITRFPYQNIDLYRRSDVADLSIDALLDYMWVYREKPYTNPMMNHYQEWIWWTLLPTIWTAVCCTQVHWLHCLLHCQLGLDGVRVSVRNACQPQHPHGQHWGQTLSLWSWSCLCQSQVNHITINFKSEI